jgi:hypothetical protein
MTNLTAHQRATQIATDFLDAELDDDQDAARWLIERITAAIEDPETAYRLGFVPLRTGH